MSTNWAAEPSSCSHGPEALVLRALGLGDLLVAVPALRLLRRALPDHRLVLAAPAALAPLVARVAAVDVHRPVGTPAEVHGRPDVAVNLHGRGPQSHAALDALGPARRVGHAAPGWDGPAWTDDPARPERRRWCGLIAACGLVTGADAAAAADDLLLDPLPSPAPAASPAPFRAKGTVGRLDRAEGTIGRNGGAAPTVVHPGAAYGSKRWPVERFAAVARALAAAGHHVVVTGSAAERDLTAAVPGTDLGGRTDLAGLLDLVASARLVVAGDTGVGHLATACATPSVTLFGPVGPAQWGPPEHPRHVVLTDPTVRRGHRFVDDPDPALLAVGVDDVVTAAAGATAAPS